MTTGSGPTGRIKFGTESNGGFKNITISNCVFDYCRGLALETVDGALLEDVSITNITMRDIVNAPIFLRLGSRMRGPAGTPVGALRRVNISNIVVYNADPRTSSLITGIPGHDIEDVRLSNIHIYTRGGGTKAQAAAALPELETGYPEPGRFGVTPAYGFLLRHVQGIELSDVQVDALSLDERPAFLVQDVTSADFQHVRGAHAGDVPIWTLKNVRDVSFHQCDPVADAKLSQVSQANF